MPVENPNDPEKKYIDSNKGGVPGFPDTFFGPKDKAYMDRLARDLVKIRGVNFRYFAKTDTPARIDGDIPGSTNPNLTPLQPKGRIASAALYGEPLNIGARIDSTKREISPAWGYASPINFRGVTMNPTTADQPDERGHFEIRKLTMHVSRAMCEDLEIVPGIGDVVELPSLMIDKPTPDNNTKFPVYSYYDVERMATDAHKFGATGFFTAYELYLVRSTKFLPQRKDLPEQQI